MSSYLLAAAISGWRKGESMSKTTWLLVLQGLGVTLQLINAQFAVITKNAAAALIFSSVLAGYQVILQRAGNNATPPPK